MFRKIGVVGAGRMGISLAHLNSGLGLDTVVIGRADPGHLTRARHALSASYAREVRRGRQTVAQAEAGLARVKVSGHLEDLAECDAVIEAVYEDLAAKREVLSAVEDAVGPQCVLLSATSSIPAGMLGEGLRRPGRVVVTHYIWPAHRRALVEMAAPAGVEPAAMERALALLRRQGRRPVLVQDRPGFVASRVLVAFWSEVLYLVRDGASPQRIDAALEAVGWPMGPCRLMDTVGMGNLRPGYDFLRPSLSERIDGLRLLFPALDAGHLGFHAGRGFYRHEVAGWTPNSAMVDLIREPGRTPPADEDIVDRCMGMILNEAAHCVTEGVVPDWKTAARLIDGAFDFPALLGGLLGYLNAREADEWRERFAHLECEHGPRFRLPEAAPRLAA